MCHFITATLAPYGDEPAVRRLAQAFLLRWEPLDHPGVLKQLNTGEGYYLSTRGMCDCGTELGAACRTDGSLPPLREDYSRDRKKLRKKGWTDAKIERWVEDSKANAARRHAEAQARLNGPHLEIPRWINFITAVLTEHHADWVGILIHWYRGQLTTEGISVGQRRWLTLSDLNADYLLRAEEDVLHTVSLGPLKLSTHR